ncbi:hypothetical protein [Ureibacillus terrenus]|nr:hypothetical protein [Ureibacillus terrenus]
MLNQYMRDFYIKQLLILGIKEIKGNPVHELTNRDLKNALHLKV